VQGMGWLTIEELIWGDRDHKWVRPGWNRTNGPGQYKIPALDDIPREFNVTLMKDTDNPVVIHSSRGIGEPPLFLGASTIFAIRESIREARKDAGLGNEFFMVDAPFTSERIRMACSDSFVDTVLQNGSKAEKSKNWRAKGSF